MALTDISTHAEAVERFINYLTESVREKRWVRILSLIGVVFALLLNPLSVEYGLGFFEVPKPGWYSSRIWLILTASFFLTAFLTALLTRKQPQPETTTTATSIIKGLLPYTNTKEDAEWFAKLQRGSILHQCMSFCLGTDSPFAILSGESGTGKTSFLQAGLLPNLDSHGRRAVYVKLTYSSPFDSIRRAINGGSENPAQDNQYSLLEFLRQTTRNDARPIVLILDQFEQFFTHHKSKTSRKLFIQQLAEWHKQGSSLPVKILISIRDDFADRLTEFHREMEYTLTMHNKLRLEKFEPQEAANVMGVIAKEAKIELDEGYVKELTRHELADSEDGTVSPVDIQIFSWMIDGQKSSEERAFNQTAFQKLGGVEGLLERFLNKQLNARETDARRQAAIKVMLALTDQNVRAGALSLKDLREKLSGVVHEGDIEEAISWLSKSEVRLITAIQEKNLTLYELAHERIIPPLRRLAFAETEDVRKAQQILDRRVNEWIGNNRARRYLLTFKEWRLITRYWTLIATSQQKEQKEEFVSLSKRRFLVVGASLGVILLFGVSAYAGYIWYERRPETRIYYAQERLVELLVGNKDAKAAEYAMTLLSVLESEKDRELSEKIWQQVGELASRDKTEALVALAAAYGKLPNSAGAAGGLERIWQAAGTLDPYPKAMVLLSLAEAYANLPNSAEAVAGLDKLQQAVQPLDDYPKADVLSAFARAYSKVSHSDKVVAGLDKLRRASETLDSHSKSYMSEKALVLSALAEAYGELPDRAAAAGGLDKVRQAAETLRLYDRVRVLSALTKAYGKVLDSDEAMGGLDKLWEALEKVRQSTESPEPYSKYAVLDELIKAYINLPGSAEAVIGLDRIRLAAEAFNPAAKATSLSSLAGAYAHLPNRIEAVAGLDKLRQAAETLDYNERVWVSLARAYGKLSDSDKAMACVGKLLEAAGEARQSTETSMPPDRARMLLALTEAYDKLAEAYAHLPNSAEAASGLDRIWQAAETLEHDPKTQVWRALKRAYAILPNRAEAVGRLDKPRQAAGTFDPSTKDGMWESLAISYAKLPDRAEAVAGLDRIRQAAETLDSPNKAHVLSVLVIAYGDLPKSAEAVAGLNKIRQAAETHVFNNQVDVWLPLAEAYSKFTETDEALNSLVRAQRAANALSSARKSLVLVKVATVYAKLSRWGEALEAARSVGNDVHEVSALSRILIIWKDAKNGTQKADALEKLLQRLDTKP